MTKKIVKKEKDNFTQAQITLIKNTVAKGATDDELKLFAYTANKLGLDPLAKQIHFVKRAGQMTIQTSIDGFRAVAERSGGLAGVEDVIYDKGTNYAMGQEPDNPTYATVTVYRMIGDNKVAFTATARWKEYFPGAKMGFMWKKMPYLMLGKCAESLALRKAFPMDLSGIYTTEEIVHNIEPEKAQNSPIEKKKAKEAIKSHKDVEVIEEGAEWEDDTPLCGVCGVDITEAEYNFSSKLYKMPSCRECQKSLKKNVNKVLESV